jgi:hypothetical protein
MAIAQRAALRGRSFDDESKSTDNYVPARGVEALGTAGLLVAVGVVLPLIVHSLGLPPRALLPMHLPVFLAAILLAPQYAIMVGVMAPALSSGFTGFPTTDQVLRMIPELATYAAVTSGLLHFIPSVPGLPKYTGRLSAIVLAMLVALVAGRFVYVGMATLISGFDGFGFYATIILAPAIPGMIAQLILIPVLGHRLQRTMTH